MEEQYRDMFGKPITKKKYEEQTKRRKKAKQKQEQKEKEYYSKFFHGDGPAPTQRIIDNIDIDEKIKGTEKSKIFKYKKGEYKGKIKDINPMAEVNEGATIKELMELLKKEKDKKKTKEKIEIEKFGRPKKKGELEASKGVFVKKRIGANDYRKGGLFLSTVDNRRK